MNEDLCLCCGVYVHTCTDPVNSYTECNTRELLSSSRGFANHFLYYLSLSLEAGINVSITDKLFAEIYPNFEYSIYNNQMRNSCLHRKYYLLGASFSIGYRFGTE